MDPELDLVKLGTLVEIRSTASMTAAAGALGYPTGAVSQQMAALQRSVRVELSTQVGRQVRLTDAGHLPARYGRRGAAATSTRPGARSAPGVRRRRPARARHGTLLDRHLLSRSDVTGRGPR
jgi:DNA-binding transcriptional LysR family regulator